MDNYIKPILSCYDTFEELIEDKSYDGNFSLLSEKHQFQFKDFYLKNSYFIVGEPGIGKTTLLNEIKDNALEERVDAFILSLNSINVDDLENKLDEICSDIVLTKPVDREENILLCLDALDEVESSLIEFYVYKIITFKRRFPNVNILVSCRTHYLNEAKHVLAGLIEFKFIRVNFFSQNQVKSFLEKREFPKDAVEEILISSTTNKGDTALKTPRYLNELVKLSQKTTLKESIRKLKRTDFYEKFIYGKLAEVHENKKTNEDLLISRVLEKLALVMEIYQVTRITEEELITFLDEIDSNLSLIFLNLCDLDKFIGRVLKKTGNIIEFDNSEFQEYLAAKELIRLGDKHQILYDFILEPTYKHIYSNWFDVLKFVLEIDSRVLLPLIEYLKNNTSKLISDNLFTLLKVIDVKAFNSEEKTLIFSVIYEYFQGNNIYIGYYNGPILAKFYTANNHKYFSQINFGSNHLVYTTNQLFMASQVFKDLDETKKIDVIAKLKSKIKSTTHKNIVSQTLSILESNNQINLLKEFIFIKDFNKECLRDYTSTSFHISKNSLFTVKLILETLDKNEDCPPFWIESINSPLSSYCFIKRISENNSLLEKIIGLNKYSSFDLDYPLFYQLDNIWNAKIEAQLRKQVDFYLSGTLYDLYNSDYFISLINCLARNDKDFLNYFLSKDPFTYDYFIQFICTNLNEFNCTALSQLNGKGGYEYIITRIILELKNTNVEKYNRLLTYFDSNFKSCVESTKTISPVVVRPTEEEIAIGDFKRDFHIEPVKYKISALHHFVKHHETILKALVENEVTALKNIILNLFKGTSLEEFKIKISKKDDRGSRTIHYSNKYIPEYPIYLKTGLLLGLNNDLASYRDRFIKLLPIIDGKENQKYILDFIGKLSPEDIQNLVSFCKDRDDDFLKYSIYNLCDIISKYQIIDLIPVLKAFIKDGDIEEHYKPTIIKTIAEVDSDSIYLNKVFETYVKKGNKNSVAEKANEYLISKYKDSSAINWRFNQLIVRKFAYTRVYNVGMSSYTDDERELDHLDFPKCLIGLRSLELIQNMNKILDFSYKNINTKKFKEYSLYLQKIVFDFYVELKYKRTIIPLQRLNEFQELNKSKFKKSFAKFLRDLEIEYTGTIFIPSNISECVKKYNTIKSNSYLNIYNSEELFATIRETINVGVKNFIEKEGFYKSFQKATETNVQTNLSIQIENLLLKKGLRAHDIIREPQSFSGKRPDFRISYGFIGPVLIEIKFIGNKDITDTRLRKAYKLKLENEYRIAFKANRGLYVIFEKTKKDYSILKEKLNKEYSDILNNWEIIYLQCYKNK